MTTIRTRRDLTELAREGLRRLTSDVPRIGVGMSSCGLAAGAGELFDFLRSEVGSKARMVRTGCMGFCGAEPLVDVSLPGRGRVLYGPVDEARAVELVTEVQAGRFAAEKALGSLEPLVGEPLMEDGVPPLIEHPFYRGQVKRVSRNLGQIDPLSLEEYVARGGYTALMRVMEQMSPEQVIEEVKQSGLRGRGGAGFPTGLKWEITRQSGTAPRYLIMNGEEGDPGAYMDRSLMEGDPHAIIEGMLIGAYAMGAETGILYVRAEYPLAVKRLGAAMEQAREAGLLGDHILGAEFGFELYLVAGAGAYVSGEETAMISALENRIAEPDPRPPYPAESGLNDRPTCINNVETWANVPLIMREGPEAFSRYGSAGSKGTKLFCLVGDVARTGLVEVPLGTSLSTIVNDIGGGARGGFRVKAVQVGGPSGGCIPATLFDLPADYELSQSVGSIMVSGGLVVLSEKTCMVDVARYFMDFTRHESCGKCTPCREGTQHLGDLLDKVTSGSGSEKDLDRLIRLSEGIKRTSLCGLGQAAPNPVLTSLDYFRNEYEAHVLEGRCPAGVCVALLTYAIDPELCTGCGLCAEECPTQAVSGRKEEAHVLDAAKCIKCDACREVCTFDAVRVQ